MTVTVSTVRVILEVLGGISLVYVPILALVRGARVEIRARDWGRPEPWHFATVDIRNAAPPTWLPLASREAALACRVTAQFYRDGAEVTPRFPCRWSDRPEPIRFELVDPRTLGAPAGPPIQIGVPEPSLVPQSQVYDLLAGGRWEEVAVAVLRDGEAYGWAADSYFYNWRKPELELDKGVYDVEVRAEWQGKAETRRFRLEYLTGDKFAFRLIEPARGLMATS